MVLIWNAMQLFIYPQLVKQAENSYHNIWLARAIQKNVYKRLYCY